MCHNHYRQALAKQKKLNGTASNKKIQYTQGPVAEEEEVSYILEMEKKDRFQYYVSHKVSPSLAKQIEELLAGKKDDTQRTPYYAYHEDLTLFKVHYCQKEIIQFQENTLLRMKEILDTRIIPQVIILILRPKRYGKTEGIIQPFITNWICFNKEDSVKYFGEVDTLAEQKIAPIKQLMENPRTRLAKDFGPFRTSTNWKASSLTIQRNRVSPDPTLEAMGIKSQKMGKNSDLIVIDDPANADMSFEVVKGIHDAIKGEILNTRNPQCPTVIIATRKGPEDIPAMFLNEECPFCDHSHTANVFILDEYKAAITKGDYKNPCGKIIQDTEGNLLERKVLRPQEDTYWLVIQQNKEGRQTPIDVIVKGDYETLAPERFTLKELIIMYWQIGEQSFDRDYQNDPTAMGGNIFKTKWLDGHEHPFQVFYDAYDMNRAHTRIMTLDLALSDAPEADYTAIVELVYDPGYAQFFQIDEDALRLPLANVFLNMEERADLFHPDIIIVEAIGMFKPLVEGWQAASKHSILYIEHKELGKVVRISATMQPEFQNGKYHLKRSHRITLKEYKDFPYSKHAHTLDAIQQAVDWVRLLGGEDVGIFGGN